MNIEKKYTKFKYFECEFFKGKFLQVTQFVEDRRSFVATVIYAVFPNRLDSYDFTLIYEHAFLGFSMAKPGLRPRWQSLYYPLAHEVYFT